ncbi:MAG: hypothetical protein MUC87_08075 [Bacteroidia bacterium]|jgi:hypothetical protein|nr:hypothetical protein [Bacteroidia bacterium]
MKKTLYIALAATALLNFGSACSDSAQADSEKKLMDESASGAAVQINREVLEELIHTLPQPIEMADIIAKSGMDFSKEILVPSDNAASYKEKYAQSLAFGAYGVDLGYINLNDKSLYALEYLESISKLSKDLSVDQFFDYSTLMELSKNKKNADSLIAISTRNFNQIDQFLREKQRGELSVLILIGAWIEGMHMFGEIRKANPNQDITNRIGEQKVVFENIKILLEKLSSIEELKPMKADFDMLGKAYDKVGISYIYKEPISKEVNGELVIIDNTETKVEMTPADADAISQQIETIRTKYLLKQK